MSLLDFPLSPSPSPFPLATCYRSPQMPDLTLTPSQRRAAAILLSLSLRQAHLHQSRHVPSSHPDGDCHGGSSHHLHGLFFHSHVKTTTENPQDELTTEKSGGESLPQEKTLVGGDSHVEGGSQLSSGFCLWYHGKPRTKNPLGEPPSKVSHGQLLPEEPQVLSQHKSGGEGGSGVKDGSGWEKSYGDQPLESSLGEIPLDKFQGDGDGDIRQDREGKPALEKSQGGMKPEKSHGGDDLSQNSRGLWFWSRSKSIPENSHGDQTSKESHDQPLPEEAQEPPQPKSGCGACFRRILGTWEKSHGHQPLESCCDEIPSDKSKGNGKIQHARGIWFWSKGKPAREKSQGEPLPESSLEEIKPEKSHGSEEFSQNSSGLWFWSRCKRAPEKSQGEPPPSNVEALSEESQSECEIQQGSSSGNECRFEGGFPHLLSDGECGFLHLLTDNEGVLPDIFSHSIPGLLHRSHEKLKPRNGNSDSDGGSAHLWTHRSSGLLLPVLRFFEIDPEEWEELEQNAASCSSPEDNIDAFLRIIFEDNEASSERLEREVALTKAVNSMTLSLEASASLLKSTEEKHHDHKLQLISFPLMIQKHQDQTSKPSENVKLAKSKVLIKREESPNPYEDACDEISFAELSTRYLRKVTLLFELLSACVADISHEDKSTCGQRKGYDARHRIALRLLATWLQIKWIKVEAMEIMVACSAMAASKEFVQSGHEHSMWSTWVRDGLIGAAAITGGTLLTITGGLAAPAIAAGFSAFAPAMVSLLPVIGASGFAAAASTAGAVAQSVAVAASFGAGAGLSKTKMTKMITSLKDFEFRLIGENHNQGRLSIGIMISGFVLEKEDFLSPWEGKDYNMERYALQWDTDELIAMSSSLQNWLSSRFLRDMIKEEAMTTVLSTLATAIAWPAALVPTSNLIDGKWSIATDRADDAGKLLAEALMKGLHGNRPVTLVGFSLGARVIFKCLQQLARSKENEGLVERVILLGGPISLGGENWGKARKMVAGRFVNVYSTNDWVLGLTFRASLLSRGLAGIQPVDIPGIENIDATDLIHGHSSYLQATEKILQRLDINSCGPAYNSTPVKN